MDTSTSSSPTDFGRRYRYYVERSLLTPGAKKGSKASSQSNGSEDRLQARGWRLPAHEIEKLVLTRLCGFLRDRAALLKALPLTHKSPDAVSAIFARAEKLAEMCVAGPVASRVEVVAALVRRIVVAQDRVTIEIERLISSALNFPLLWSDQAALIHRPNYKKRELLV